MKHRFACRPSTLSWLASLYLGAASSLALACAGDDEDDEGDEPRAALVGGWSDLEANLFVCIAKDWRMWLGDSRSELSGPSHCVVDPSGVSFECTGPDAGESFFRGNIRAYGDRIALDLIPCPPDGECHGLYSRDASVTCDE